MKANAWPFFQGINRSSVAAVTGEIRDWLCPRLSHHPSSSVMSAHMHASVRVSEYTVRVCVYGCKRQTMRMIKETEER